MTQRHGDWIQTFTGKQFYPADPRPEDVDIRDIAHSLSHICRFNGHCSRHYSVAEHSILVALHVAWDDAHSETRAQDTLAALLHDASEAYLCDIPRPLKRMPEMAPYRAMEANVERVIAERFGLPYPMPAIVKRHDERALATEYRDLVLSKHHGWSLREKPWEDMPPGCLVDTQTAFDGMLPIAFLSPSGNESWWVEHVFTAMYARLTTGPDRSVDSLYYEIADHLLRCLPEPETPRPAQAE